MKKIALLLLIVLTSCRQNSVYHEYYRDFQDNRWTEADAKSFPFSIAADGSYDITLEVSHVYSFQFQTVSMLAVIAKPDGTIEEIPFELSFTDESGQDLGSCLGDVCDLNFNIKNGVNLTKGDYKIVISNRFIGPYLPNILGVGLTVTDSKK